MRSVWIILKEQVNNFYLVRRLSLYELKSANRNNYLGILWEIINPMIQIGIYWFVFGFGIRGSGKHYNIDSIPFHHWLFAGFVIWFFINQAIVQGSKSIYSRIRTIAKMSFPLSVIPTYVIVSKFYQHLMFLAVIYVILLLSGESVSVYIVQLPYFMFAVLMFVIALSLITSTLATIVRDVQMIVQSIVRMLLYLTPVLWTSKNALVQTVMLINPITYVVDGYRAALLGTSWYGVAHWHYTIYFWTVTLAMLIIGSVLHLRFRDHFVDYL
ncbi:ABC transporter permease [Caenibacillus caldisaponilyticus]|uniref:ABC transporter permease n=1 Tax=Caenibacillus caldisaponilyticus TaxID=1674942 RepID=UPI0009886944|nr:ABC transporter permease [Caenibacillus caldisaponilyticus]